MSTSHPPTSSPPSPAANQSKVASSSGVDNFGRTKRTHDDTPVRRGRSPPREWNSGSGRGGGRGYGRSSGRQRSRSRPRDNSDRPYREPSAGPSRRSPPPTPARSTSPKVSRSRIAPMKSYKNFMLTQSDDASPDIFQRRYDEYQVQYCKDASNYYFEKNKCEEWFRERYDPLIQQNMETESQEWAQAESQKIFDRVAYDKSGFLSSARLSPLECSEGDDKSITASLHHFDGHSDRAISLTGIPAICTKTILSQSIRTALAAVSEESSPLGVERVLLAQPNWITRFYPPAFDRVGWVILTPESSVQTALRVLNELRVTVPGPIDSATGEPIGGHSFRVQASLHYPKNLSLISAVHSSPSRIQFDYDRAYELAVLFDEEKSIPTEHNLKNVIELFGDSLDLSDKLDVVILYLRRVHFFIYYIGKRFRGEAHLTVVSPNILHRIPPQDPEPMVEAEQQADTSTTEETSVEQETVLAQEGEPTEEHAEVIPLVNLEKAYSGRTELSVQTLDQRINEFILAARKRVTLLRKRKYANDSNLLADADEEDAKTIFKAQEKVLEQITVENCVVQSDGKARCGLTWCNKLFKGHDFLMKHIRNKHIDLALVRLVRVSEQYMFTRFMAEDICKRPLGPIEVETGGTLEQKTVKEVYESAVTRLGDVPSLLAPVAPRSERGNGSRHSGGGGGSRGGGYVPFRRDDPPRRDFDRRDRFRDYDRGDRRVSDGDRRSSRQDFDDDRRGRRRESAPSTSIAEQEQAPLPPTSEGSQPPPPTRKLQSYVDIDSPMEVAVNIDYGVVLPPPKKRKLVPKVE